MLSSTCATSTADQEKPKKQHGRRAVATTVEHQPLLHGKHTFPSFIDDVNALAHFAENLARLTHKIKRLKSIPLKRKHEKKKNAPPYQRARKRYCGLWYSQHSNCKPTNTRKVSMV